MEHKYPRNKILRKKPKCPCLTASVDLAGVLPAPLTGVPDHVVVRAWLQYHEAAEAAGWTDAPWLRPKEQRWTEPAASSQGAGGLAGSHAGVHAGAHADPL